MSNYPTFYADGNVIFWAVPHYQYGQWRVPGVYMLCRCEANGSRCILYIGEAHDISGRLGRGHEHWNAALHLGMNEVHVHLLATTAIERRTVETRLRRRYPTPLNQQLPRQQAQAISAEMFRATTMSAPPQVRGGLMTGFRWS